MAAVGASSVWPLPSTGQVAEDACAGCDCCGAGEEDAFARLGQAVLDGEFCVALKALGFGVVQAAEAEEEQEEGEGSREIAHGK
jgi:hypothetical protein